jgi:glycosyltransferase involved in cell wall biosynthesis
MQIYLGEYPGSRSNSDKKFLRAVESFINQTDKDSELVIVSDGCEITHNLYYKHFKSNDRIKYVYVDKDTPNMYEGEKKFFRGLPREVGRVISTGEVISYMDSDDIIIKNYIKYLKYFWNKHPEKDWGINFSWYDNIHRKNNPLPYEEKICEDSSNEDEIKIDGLESSWYAVKGKPNSIPMQPWVLSHKNHVKTMWRDTTGKSEDVDFNIRLRKEHSNGFKYIDPMYVRCHYSNRWDY